ncbi:unnamed protein product [Aphanomyces euteiches]
MATLKYTAAVAATAVLAGSTWLYQNAVQKRRQLEAKAKQNAIVVIDIGSSSVRASAYVLYQDTWTLVPGSLHQHKMRALASDGTAEFHVVKKVVEGVIDGTLQWLAQDGGFRVLAVGFSSFAMSLVGVDGQGTPVTPVLTYAGRCAAEAKSLNKTLAQQGLQQEIYNRTGAPIHSAYAAPQLLKLQDKNSVESWQSLVGVMLRQWTTIGGPVPMGYSEASWTGLFDFRQGIWDAKLLELSHTNPSTMPEIQDPSVPVPKLNSKYAARWPLLSQADFYLALGDGAAANIGSKSSTPDRIGLTVGTSAALRVMCPLSEMKRVPRGLWCYRVDKENVILGGALTDGGSVYEWATRTLALSPGDAKKLESMEPNSHGLTFLPFLSGERAPGWHQEATCTISGITTSTTPVDILRASLESVALRLGAIYALFGEYVSSDAIVVASGTALSSSSLWRQIIADVLGRAVWIETDAVELTSRGPPFH